MQDPGGDGKIVYLFLPLYQVRLTVSVCCSPMPPLPRLAVQRTVIVALEHLNIRSMAHKPTVSHVCVDDVWSGLHIHFGGLLHGEKPRPVRQFVDHHLFRCLGYYQVTQSTQLFSHLVPVTTADSH